MKRIAVYGTLRKGCGLDGMLYNAKYLDTVRISGLKLYEYFGLPALAVGKEKDSTVVEVYDIEEKDYLPIKRLEENAGYLTTLIRVGKEELIMWIHPKAEFGEEIISGDYTKRRGEAE